MAVFHAKNSLKWPKNENFGKTDGNFHRENMENLKNFMEKPRKLRNTYPALENFIKG